MRKLTTVTFGACFVLVFCQASAQTPGAIQQVDSAQQRRQMEQTAKSYRENEPAPELYPGESTDVARSALSNVEPGKSHFVSISEIG